MRQFQRYCHMEKFIFIFIFKDLDTWYYHDLSIAFDLESISPLYSLHYFYHCVSHNLKCWMNFPRNLSHSKARFLILGAGSTYGRNFAPGPAHCKHALARISRLFSIAPSHASSKLMASKILTIVNLPLFCICDNFNRSQLLHSPSKVGLCHL